MPTSGRAPAKVFLALNIVAALVFAYLWLVHPLGTDLQVRARYTELDREGVINESVLQKFHPGYGFTADHRNSVPRYIAGPALDGQRANALLALALAASNIVLGVALLLGQRQAHRQ